MQLNVVMLLEPDFVSMKLVVTLEPVISSAHLSVGFIDRVVSLNLVVLMAQWVH